MGKTSCNQQGGDPAAIVQAVVIFRVSRLEWPGERP